MASLTADVGVSSTSLPPVGERGASTSAHFHAGEDEVAPARAAPQAAGSFSWQFPSALQPSPMGASLWPPLPGSPAACLCQGLLEIGTLLWWAGREAESCFCLLWRKTEKRESQAPVLGGLLVPGAVTRPPTPSWLVLSGLRLAEVLCPHRVPAFHWQFSPPTSPDASRPIGWRAP